MRLRFLVTISVVDEKVASDGAPPAGSARKRRTARAWTAWWSRGLALLGLPLLLALARFPVLNGLSISFIVVQDDLDGLVNLIVLLSQLAKRPSRHGDVCPGQRHQQWPADALRRTGPRWQLHQGCLEQAREVEKFQNSPAQVASGDGPSCESSCPWYVPCFVTLRYSQTGANVREYFVNIHEYS